MKTNLTLLLIAACLMMTAGSVFGHGEIQTKAKCTWGWKYKAKSRVNNGIGITAQTVQSCGCYSLTASVSNPCAWQTTTNNCGWGSFSGSVFATPWLCGRGYANSEMFYDMMQYNSQTRADTAERVNVTNSSIEFSSRGISINKVVGYLEARNDMRALYHVRLWLPNHDLRTMVEDTIIDSDEVLWEGKITIINGKVLLEGGFAEEQFEVKQGRNKTRLLFNGETFNIPVPRGIDVNELTVSILSDGGYNEQQSFRVAEENTETAIKEGLIKMDVFPNPAKGEFNVKFKSNKEGNVEVKLYNFSGKLVKSVFKSEAKKNEEINVKVDTKSLNLIKGLYFIYVDNNRRIYIKKVMVE